jgi:hypothetical protein
VDEDEEEAEVEALDDGVEGDDINAREAVAVESAR